jgi:DNA modification methylase
MKLIEIDIASIKIKDEFGIYERVQNLELDSDLEVNDVIDPVVVDIDGYLVDGKYRKIFKEKIGHKTIWALQMDRKATIDDVISFNQTRAKTDMDLVRELEYKMGAILKKQGRKKNGQKLTFEQNIKSTSGFRWKDADTYNKINRANKCDFPNKRLTISIIKNQCTPNAANTFLDLNKYDKEYKLGYSEKVESGELKPDEANKLIKKFLEFQTEKKKEFIIPEKCYSYKMDCTTIEKLVDFQKQVDLIFTSIPYYKQKKYKLGEMRQPWNFGTPEEYCEYMADIVKSWIITLKDSASLMINVNDVFENGVSLRIPDMLINAILSKTNLKYYQTLIWSKKNCMSGGTSEKKRPKNNIEYILWFVVDPKQVFYKPIEYHKFNTNAQNLRGFGHENVVGKKFAKKLAVTSGYSTIWTHITEQDTEGVILSSVGTNHKIFDVVKTSHPSVLSGYVPVCPILFASPEHGLVYDPMSGSNIVGYISQVLNRRSLSTELSSLYFKDGCENLQNAIKQFNPEGLKITNQIAFGIDNTDLDNAA